MVPSPLGAAMARTQTGSAPPHPPLFQGGKLRPNLHTHVCAYIWAEVGHHSAVTLRPHCSQIHLCIMGRKWWLEVAHTIRPKLCAKELRMIWAEGVTIQARTISVDFGLPMSAESGATDLD